MGNDVSEGEEKDPIPKDSELNHIFKVLKSGKIVDDAYFDRIYPDWAKKSSRLHWTPVSVAVRAVKFLTLNQPEARILDVGAGAGKFCLIGSSISKARFEGVEQRSHLVALSQNLIHQYQLPRIHFIFGDLRELDWAKYDAIYLYNPFEEHRSQKESIDSTIRLERTRFAEYVNIAYFQLAKMPVGTRVMTYHGFGGAVPPTYRSVLREYYFQGPLECWVKDR